MKPNYSRYRPRYTADDVMEIACEQYCRHYSAFIDHQREDWLQAHCKECRLKLRVHLSVPN